MIAISLNDLYERKLSLFDLNDQKVKKWTVKWWNKITTDRKLDLTLYSKDIRLIEIDSIEHKDVREVGIEWMCYNIWQKLKINEVLQRNGFSEQEIQLVQKQVISGAVHLASELATAKWIKENSAICELFGFP